MTLFSVAALFSVSGCAAYPDSAWEQLKTARSDYQNQYYGAATRKLDAIVDQYPDHPDSAEAYYVRALCYVHLSQKVYAEADARQCIKLARHDDLKADAHATLATLLYEANRSSEALDHFARALRSSRKRAEEDVLRYRYGLCLLRAGRWTKARQAFAVVYQRFPNQPTAEHAKRLHDWPHDAYSIQCGAFRDQASATKLNGRLKRAGLRSRIESHKRTGEMLHTVYVGKYPRYGQARDALPAVQRRVSDAYIMPQ